MDVKINSKQAQGLKLKQYKGQLTQLDADINEAKLEVKRLQNVIKSKADKSKSLRRKVKALMSKHANPVVSDHAIVRYVERVLGHNIEEIRDSILSQEVKDMVDVLGGSGHYPNSSGFKVVMKGYTVTTII